MINELTCPECLMEMGDIYLREDGQLLYCLFCGNSDDIEKLPEWQLTLDK